MFMNHSLITLLGLEEEWVLCLINPFFTKPENEKLWNIPNDVFNVLDFIWDTGLEYDLEKIFKILYVP
jgi:hypothetical protein